MPDISPILALVLLLVLGAEFVNGWTDAPNAIATVVSTRVLSPRKAVLMAAVLNMAGAFSGTAVATTIGKGIVKPEVINIQTVGIAMVTIILWSTLAWYFGGLPTSESHELVAALAGAGLVVAGPSVLIASGWQKVAIGLLFSTFLGFLGGLSLMVALLRLLYHRGPATVRAIFSRAQILSAAFMAYSHGSNDGQKFMGAFSLALFLSGILSEFRIPIWVILLCASTMGLGTAVGGWRIIRTMGLRVTHLEPVHGFAAETAAASAIVLASHLGIPLSTTHTIGTAIMGVGASRRISAVRWGIANDIVLTWILTFPACAAIGALLALSLKLF
ncbi:MAG: inorganic phosphate transporter [Chloroflexi bacterium]|nr:inorganic phosphate transporter [Chloroflexota bacterium]